MGLSKKTVCPFVLVTIVSTTILPEVTREHSLKKIIIWLVFVGDITHALIG